MNKKDLQNYLKRQESNTKNRKTVKPSKPTVLQILKVIIDANK